MWNLPRGIGHVEQEIPFNREIRIPTPPLDRASDYLAKLKVVIEIVFDIPLASYITGTESQLLDPKRGAMAT